MLRKCNLGVSISWIVFAATFLLLCLQQCQAQFPASKRSNVSVKVTFKNIDTAPITVQWVGYKGETFEPETIQPGKSTGGGSAEGFVHVFKKGGKVIRVVTVGNQPEQVFEIRDDSLDIYKYKNSIEIGFSSKFNKLWADFGSGAKKNVVFYRPVAERGFFPLGDFAVGNYDNPNGKHVVFTVKDISPNQDALRPPARWKQVWNSFGSSQSANAVIYQPIPPEGYVAMGLVTRPSWNGAPKLEDFRCVRADLVQPAGIGGEIWSNIGGEDDSNWACYKTTSSTSSPGEVAVSPGTFVGVAGWNGLGAHSCAYSLKLTLPQKTSTNNFEPPKLTGFSKPSGFENLERTSITSVPWFAVNDPQLSDAEKMKQSPVYRLVRRDKYNLLAHYHNQTDGDQSEETITTTGFTETDTNSFSKTTGIAFKMGYKAGDAKLTGEVSCELTLSQSFTHGWSNSRTKTAKTDIKLPIKVKAGTAVALFQVGSSYTLFRGNANGTQIGKQLSGSDDKSWFITQFPQQK